jgi:hypothetical protein
VRSVARTAVPGARAAIVGAIGRISGAGATVSGDESVPLSSESHHPAIELLDVLRSLVVSIAFDLTLVPRRGHQFVVDCWIMDVGDGVYWCSLYNNHHTNNS